MRPSDIEALRDLILFFLKRGPGGGVLLLFLDWLPVDQCLTPTECDADCNRDTH